MSTIRMRGDFIDDERRRFPLSANTRGALIVVLGSAAIVGLAFAAMVVLTSPDGWVTKATNSAYAGEDVQLVAYEPPGN